jgi:hypothetical protein
MIGNRKFVIYPAEIGLVRTFFRGLMRTRGKCDSIGTCFDPVGRLVPISSAGQMNEKTGTS